MSYGGYLTAADLDGSVSAQATSTLHNLKELRPASRGRSEIRILLVFDPDRTAIFLVAGDKAGQWSHWYETAVPIAKARYAEYRSAMDKEAGR
jgi:hypothetical protein